MTEKLRKDQKTKISTPQDIFSIMQKILLRKSKQDRDKELFWTMSLNGANKIIHIELVGIGTINEVLMKPMEVFSIPLQKRSVKLILIHNHPSGETIPSEVDMTETNRLVQIGNLLELPIIDHLIISSQSYYSFKENGILDEIIKSSKYLPAFMLEKLINEISGLTQNRMVNYMND